MATIRIDESGVAQAGAVTVTVTAEPLTVLSDPVTAGADVSRAIAAGLGNATRNIQELARGGKHRLFNRTGELAAGIVAVLNANGYDIVPPDRYLQDDALFDRLVQLVPAIDDPFVLAGVQTALENTVEDMIRIEAANAASWRGVTINGWSAGRPETNAERVDRVNRNR